MSVSHSISEDGDIFEITDFTTASDFERFIAGLEEIIHEMKLAGPRRNLYAADGFDINTALWHEMHEEISFIDFPFVVTRHFIKDPESDTKPTGDVVAKVTKKADEPADEWPVSLLELNANNQDFPGKAHCLCRWFGLTDFVVIAPKSYAISNQSKLKILLSAVMVAIQNSGCRVPIFVQCLENSRKFYLGHFQSQGVETEFEMVHLKTTPSKYSHLSGLLDVFKGKLNTPIDPKPPVLVTVRFTYILQDWEEYLFDWPQIPSNFEDADDSPVVGLISVLKLPFGACEDPIEDLHLSATWPNISEEVITESAVYSDLDPLHAPHWTVRVTMAPSPQCLLSDCILKFCDLCECSETLEQVLGRLPSGTDDTVDITQALERLTEPQTSYNLSLSKVTKAISRPRLNHKDNSPIPTSVLNKILLHLFPDAKQTTQQASESASSLAWKEKFRLFKTAPVVSPVFSLAICSCTVNYGFGGLKAVAHLWHEFVLEMRYRLENSYLIPNIEKGSPNLAQGIIYQKIQMLNCCIEKKIQREKDENLRAEKESRQDASVLSYSESSFVTFHADESDEEFYECDNSEIAERDSGTSADVSHLSATNVQREHLPPCSTRQSLYEDSMQYQPQGRLSRLGDMKLLHVDEPLYVPVTQEPAPMTEDMLAEHAEVLTQLGTTPEAASLRAKMQSASLLSDMESFKAANPGCVLEDFVRWYSPRDCILETFIDEETGNTSEKYTLSERMLVAGNMWQEMWENSKPVPARRQKRLFDDTKEAEKVLHYLSSMKPAQLVLHLLPMMCQAALLTLLEEGNELMSSLTGLMDSLTTKLEGLTRQHIQSVPVYSDIINQIKMAELAVARARSLHLKFACDEENKGNEEVRTFVLNLMAHPEVRIVGASRGAVGKVLTKMFANAKAHAESGDDSVVKSSKNKPENSDSVFSAPAAREYILRTVVPSPAPYSKPLPQRMYCTLIDDKEYRLAGAFTMDSIFQ